MAINNTVAPPNVVIRRFRFETAFGSPDLYRNQEEHAAEVDAFIRRQPDRSWIGLDLRGLQYVGYSYAKPTIRRPIIRQISGEYDKRRLILIGNQEPDFFDGIERALRDERMAALLAAQEEETANEWQIIGELPDYLYYTFRRLINAGVVTTAEFADVVEESVQNTNNRLRRLHALGLINRWKVDSPSGGREWMSAAVSWPK